MIALNREMPRHCLHDNCPCMQTVTAEDTHGRKVMGRLCMAHGGAILYVCDLTDNPPEDWMEFKKPSWCPWIKIEETKEELAFNREFESHWF